MATIQRRPRVIAPADLDVRGDTRVELPWIAGAMLLHKAMPIDIHHGIETQVAVGRQRNAEVRVGEKIDLLIGQWKRNGGAQEIGIVAFTVCVILRLELCSIEKILLNRFE